MPTMRLVFVYLISISESREKSKLMGSGGSIVTRLKLKGIDGRVPSEVELAT